MEIHPSSESHNMLSEYALIRLPQVLEVLPICRSSFYNGIRSGDYPSPVHIGRTSVWRTADIVELLERIGKAA
ncbi:MAG: hypothetical protein FD177_2704 [Desulfovibrionaceae bacterium]|nr:MAG: hypothetical protein FD177_2704 [Desulfovibrionaceae bacterium]